MTGGTSLYLAALWWQSAPAGCMGEDLDEVCAAFRALSDKTKLMLLMRLSEGRSYCQQLAEENGSNTGNMSAVWLP